MKYNIYINGHNGDFNLFNLEKESVEKVADAYKEGLSKFTINHKQYQYDHIYEIAIVTNEKEWKDEALIQYASTFRSSFGFGDPALDTKLLSQFGVNVTSDFIDDELFGYKLDSITEAIAERADIYVNQNRLDELRQLNPKGFDLSKLIKICEEINSNWQSENYFTVGLLLRTAINHVPPIFGTYQTFDQVVANYGNRSFKGVMEQLNKSLRNIADGYTHHLIGRKEPLPNDQQVDYKSSFDVLLAEIVRILHPII